MLSHSLGKCQDRALLPALGGVTIETEVCGIPIISEENSEHIYVWFKVLPLFLGIIRKSANLYFDCFLVIILLPARFMPAVRHLV
jgi:hypothetical protein